MRNELISTIMAVVQRVADSVDVTCALDPEALRAARELMARHFERQPAIVDVGVFQTVATLHWMRYQALPPEQAEEDLRTALRLCRALAVQHPELLAPPLRTFVAQGDELLAVLRIEVLSHAAQELADRHGDPGSRLTALAEAASLLGRALLLAEPYESQLPNLWNELGIVWQRRFECTGDLWDIGRSERWHRTAVEAVEAGEGRAGLLYGLASCLHARFEMYDQLEDADEAIDVRREVLRLISSDDENRVRCLAALAHTLLSRFEKTEQRTDLLDAWEAIDQALHINPVTRKDRALVLSDLCRAARLRFECSNERAFLNQAIEAGREAVALTPPDDADFPERQNRLGMALGRRFDLLGKPVDLRESILAARAALSAGDFGLGSRLRYLVGLAQALVRAYEHDGLAEVLNEAIELCGRAAAELVPGGPRHTAVLATLCGALAHRYRESGRLDDLDAAIEVGNQAAEAAAPGSSERGLVLGNLQAVLTERYKYTLEDRDLDEAVRTAGDARDAGALNTAYRTAAGINLAHLLMTRFAGADKAQRDSSDLDRAVDVLRQTVTETSPCDRHRSWVRSDLAGALLMRASVHDNPEDLSEALAICRDAMAEAAVDDPFRGRVLSRLSDALLMMFETSGRTEELVEALELELQASEAEAGPGRNAGLAAKLAVKASHTGNEDDVREAIRANRSIAEDETSMPWLRMQRAHAWTSLAVRHGDRAAALEGFAAGVRLLPMVSWRGSDLGTRERHLSDWAGLAASAASYAISAGEAERAVELLEHGRSVLWAQTLQVRDDMTELHAVAPDLAAQLLQVQALLNADETAQVAASVGREVMADPGRRHRARWAREWEELVARARELPGFKRFLAPPTFAELAAAADPSPVVLVNVSGLRCDALVVARGRVDVVPLPALDLDSTLNLCNAFLSSATGRRAGMAGALALRANIASISRWLWRAVAEPVLNFLGHDAPPTKNESWPHVCWSLVGPLGFLPVHAASDLPLSEQGHQSVLDRVVSSYTPTLSALRRTHKRGTTPESAGVGDAPSLLAVGMPETPGSTPLPGVPEELTRVRRRLSSTVEVTEVVGEAADRETVMRLLDTHAWVHFACHGSQQLEDPGQGGVHLWNGILTVREMAALRLPKAQLAYLSACNTAVGGNRLLDEAVHLAAALQVVGYPHVIATLWQAQDQESADVAEAVYRVLTSADGPPDADRAATALHEAVRALRERYPHQPDIWAPYVHVGM